MKATIDDGGYTSNVVTGPAIALEFVPVRFALGCGCGEMLT